MPKEVEHCALLSVNTLKAACSDYVINDGEDFRRNEQAGGDGCSCGGSGECSSSGRRPSETETEYRERLVLEKRMSRIRRKIVVLSGKGGVGKSTVAVNLAVALRLAGKRVGLLDVDIHGPSVPTLLGLEGETIESDNGVVFPIDCDGLKVMSLGFFLKSPDDAVIWRGPMKMGVITQFLRDVDWGDLDVLVIDSPPGTGDEPLSVCQLIDNIDGAVIVTTPQRVAVVDVRKSITFCRQLGLPVLGVIENMSGFACPCCGEVTPILRSGGGQRIADDMRVPFLGSIPIDPRIAETADEGVAFVDRFAASPAAAVLREIIKPIEAMDPEDTGFSNDTPSSETEKDIMRIAIPIADGKLALHFGHCERFALIDVDPAAKTIVKREDVAAPAHQPGLLPPWLAERGATVILAGGMGQRAQSLFAEQGIKVIVGAPAEAPETLATQYLAGTLQAGENVCDH
jgi:Mrp family chromosome partitioning ATPase/predicted Fe-Mo cluster-binding NifX family protein